eukprot:COSAG05_NODE_6105_length_1021_cov_2.505423_2_plen_74_part_00
MVVIVPDVVVVLAVAVVVVVVLAAVLVVVGRSPQTFARGTGTTFSIFLDATWEAIVTNPATLPILAPGVAPTG